VSDLPVGPEAKDFARRLRKEVGADLTHPEPPALPARPISNTSMSLSTQRSGSSIPLRAAPLCGPSWMGLVWSQFPNPFTSRRHPFAFCDQSISVAFCVAGKAASPVKCSIFSPCTFSACKAFVKYSCRLSPQRAVQSFTVAFFTLRSEKTGVP
jgi:hypothetical protein